MGIHTLRRVGREYDLVIVVSLLWFMVQFLRFAFPPLFETFQGIYSISNSDVGILFTSLLMAYSMVQFPAGALSDTFGRPFIMFIGVGVFTLSASLVAGSPTFVFLTVSVILLGLGTGPHKAVAVPLLSNQYGDRTGRTLGVMETIGQFGGMVAPLVVVLFLNVFVWQGIFLLSSLVSLLLGVLLVVSVRRSKTLSFRSSPPERTAEQVSQNRRYLTTFADRRLLTFVLITIIFTFSWNGFSAFFPLFLTTEKGISPSFASILYSLVFVASLSQTVTGDLSDRVGRLRVGAMLFVVLLVGVFLLLIAENVVIIGVLSLVIGVGFHGFRPVRDSYLMDLIPDDVGGGTLGIIRTFMTGIGALAPAAIGFLSSTMSFTVAYGVIGGIISVGCVVMFSLHILYPSSGA